MVKGVSRRVVVVRPPDQRLFEQAIFILRDDAPAVGAGEVVAEARRLTRDYTGGKRIRRWLAGALWAAAGAVAVGAAWLLTVLV